LGKALDYCRERGRLSCTAWGVVRIDFYETLRLREVERREHVIGNIERLAYWHNLLILRKFVFLELFERPIFSFFHPIPILMEFASFLSLSLSLSLSLFLTWRSEERPNQSGSSFFSVL